MKNEYDYLDENNARSIVRSDEEKKGSRWHFTVKFDPDGLICHFKRCKNVLVTFSETFFMKVTYK